MTSDAKDIQSASGDMEESKRIAAAFRELIDCGEIARRAAIPQGERERLDVKEFRNAVLKLHDFKGRLAKSGRIGSEDEEFRHLSIYEKDYLVQSCRDAHGRLELPYPTFPNYEKWDTWLYEAITDLRSMLSTLPSEVQEQS